MAVSDGVPTGSRSDAYRRAMSPRRGAAVLLLLTSLLSSCGRVDHVFFAVHRRAGGAELLFSTCNTDRPPPISEVRVTVLRHRRRVVLWRIVAGNGRAAPLASAVVGRVPPRFVERVAVAGRHFGPWLGVEARTRTTTIEPAGPIDLRLPYDHSRARTSGAVIVPRRDFPAWARDRCDHRPGWLALAVIVGLLALPAGAALAGGLLVRAVRRRRTDSSPDAAGDGSPAPGAPVGPSPRHPPPLPPAI